MVICMLVMGLSSCALSLDPKTGNLAFSADPVAVAAIVNHATARLNEELAGKAVPVVPDEKIKPAKVEIEK